MKTVSAMDVRRHFGALLNEVGLKSERVLIERGGKPVAMLTPLDPPADRAHERKRRQSALARLCGMAGITSRGRKPDKWLAHERAAWADRER
ncbi:MAG: type II toxin-antitoxin system Phd/YefM family antitoxin [Lentisphaerae bacterium]|nr:type II toxin-antitoxin system Phd/YefM family antitoxin [Lentisphaerota bacterium]